MDDHMTCDDARLALWPDPNGPAAAEARAHYEGCADCRRFFRVQEALSGRIGSMTRPGAPDALRERVVAALAAEPRSRRFPRRVWIPAGLAAAAALALAIGLRAPDQGRLATTLVSHASRTLAPNGETFRSTNFQEVETWLRQRAGHEVELPRITDAQILGGRVIELDGQATVAAVYELHGMPLTYFAVPAGRMAGYEITVAAGVRSAEAQGYEVAVWAEPGGLRAVAAPMSRRDVQAVAEECRNKALMRAL